MKQCSHCGHVNPAEEQRCRNCLAWLDTSTEETKPYLQQVRELLRQEKKIDAIKVYREATGASLAAAKHAVECIARGEEPPPVSQPHGLDDEVLQKLREGRKIEAIKIYRDKTGAGLAEAKQAVEALGVRHGILGARGCASAILCIGAFVVAIIVWTKFG